MPTSDGNGQAERFTRAFKELQLWLRFLPFVAELNAALSDFNRHCNHRCRFKLFDCWAAAEVRAAFVAPEAAAGVVSRICPGNRRRTYSIDGGCNEKTNSGHSILPGVDSHVRIAVRIKGICSEYEG